MTKDAFVVDKNMLDKAIAVGPGTPSLEKTIEALNEDHALRGRSVP